MFEHALMIKPHLTHYSKRGATARCSIEIGSLIPMKILIAEDDPISRQLLQSVLSRWGYHVFPADNGLDTWRIIEQEGQPLIVVLDWMMPDIDGLEICRLVRTKKAGQAFHLILLTAYGRPQDVIKGLESGADDYICKPFDIQELRARIRVGERVLQLQTTLSKRVQELETAMSQVKTLQGLVPICSYCKKIRDDQNFWHQLEKYISEHSSAVFSHGICPDCYKKFMNQFDADATPHEEPQF